MCDAPLEVWCFGASLGVGFGLPTKSTFGAHIPVNTSQRSRSKGHTGPYVEIQTLTFRSEPLPKITTPDGKPRQPSGACLTGQGGCIFTSPSETRTTTVFCNTYDDTNASGGAVETSVVKVQGRWCAVALGEFGSLNRNQKRTSEFGRCFQEGIPRVWYKFS